MGRMISYLELLQMVKEDNAPELICLHLNCGNVDYQIYYDDGEFNYYGLCNENEENENFKYYLADTLLESQMIEKNIEILEDEEEFEDIEKLYNCLAETDNEIEKILIQNINDLSEKINQLIRNQKKIIERLNNE